MDFQNLVQLTQYFNSEEKCREYLRFMRWEDGEPVCEFCGHEKCYQFKGGKIFKCASCKRRFSITRGTIFHATKISLQKWFVGLFLLSNHKRGISSYQLASDLGIHQSSGWHLGHRIRKLMERDSDIKLSGEVEIDEWFVGGSEEFKHDSKKIKGNKGKSLRVKAGVLGMIERGGMVIPMRLDGLDQASIIPLIEKNVEKGSIVYTDEFGTYSGLHKAYSHYAIRHKLGEYVSGTVSTNTIENFWSHFARGVVGTYYHISPKHVDRYCAGFAYRMNTRNMNCEERFDLALCALASKRLPMRALVAA
jgi:transposase-like protein